MTDEQKAFPQEKVNQYTMCVYHAHVRGAGDIVGEMHDYFKQEGLPVHCLLELEIPKGVKKFMGLDRLEANNGSN